MQDFCNLSSYKFILHLELITCSLRTVRKFHVYQGKEMMQKALINLGTDFQEKSNAYPN